MADQILLYVADGLTGQLVVSFSRRYSEFHALRKMLLNGMRGHYMCDIVEAVEFPAKTKIKSKNSPKVTEARAIQLTRWLGKMFELEHRCRADQALIMGSTLLGAPPLYPLRLPHKRVCASARTSNQLVLHASLVLQFDSNCVRQFVAWCGAPTQQMRVSGKQSVDGGGE